VTPNPSLKAPTRYGSHRLAAPGLSQYHPCAAKPASASTVGLARTLGGTKHTPPSLRRSKHTPLSPTTQVPIATRLRSESHDTRRSMMRLANVALFVSLSSANTLVWAADAAERGFIRKGMKEGEVVLKIGKPDHEAFIRNVKGLPEEKTWTYFPHANDPQTLTVLTLKAGVVESVERKISR
jgi:hypothetical protein